MLPSLWGVGLRESLPKAKRGATAGISFHPFTTGPFDSVPKCSGTFFSMAVSSSSDLFILALGVVLAALYLFRDQIFAAAKPKAVSLPPKLLDSDENPRDFIAKMKNGVSRYMTELDISLTICV